MREYTTPARVPAPVSGNLADAVFTNAREAPDDVVFSRKVAGQWQPVTAREFAEQVRELAKGLVAAGVRPGDRVGLMSATRYEWTLIDYAIWTAGAVTVPVYETSSAEQIQWILSDSGADCVFLETDAHREAYSSVQGELPAIRHAWPINDAALARLVASGTEVAEEELERRRSGTAADDLATIIYTSGTTGRPKGCELTHGNFLFDARNTTEGLTELFGSDQSTLLFLPLAHVFARIIQVGCVLNRVRMGHTHDIKNLLTDFQAFEPTFILSVPRVFEKVYNTAKQTAHADGKGRIFDAAERTAVAYSEAMDGRGPGPLLKAKHALFDRAVYARLRAALGGQVHSAISGGAPLGARLGHYFRGIGIPVYEGYGLTETTAGATMNLPDAMKVGTVGRPVPGVSAAIAADGEILLRGGNIFRGYWQNETATKETLDEDGWFHTGDVGQLDDEGFLTITGRKKELIVTAGGKNVAPAVLEDRIRAHPLISQAVVVGDRRPFIAALVTIDPESYPKWLADHDKPASEQVDVDDPQLRAEVQAAVDDANRAVSKAESIRSFQILPGDFTVEGGELTPSLKVKRNVVLDRYGDAVDALYATPAAG